LYPGGASAGTLASFRLSHESLPLKQSGTGFGIGHHPSGAISDKIERSAQSHPRDSARPQRNPLALWEDSAEGVAEIMVGGA
jgi:hypothetical protein